MTLEELQELLLKTQEELKTANELNTNLTTEKTTLESKVRDLQDHNQKLFLKIQTPEQQKQDEEIIPVEEFAKTLKF